jgi:hypothetical protein
MVATGYSARGRLIKHSCQDIGEPGLRIDVVELRGLCRPPNYAERARFPKADSSSQRIIE